jgi:hypothetical protein
MHLPTTHQGLPEPDAGKARQSGSEGAPAQRCAGATRQEESAIGEVKTHVRGRGEVLRSQSPAMVEQQMWGLLLAHYATRALLVEAADEAGYDPDRTSFIRGLRVVRRQVTDQAAISP